MLAIGGNFHLQHNNKGVGKDTPLTGNAGFWVDDGELDDYITAKGAKVEEQEKVGHFQSVKPKPSQTPLGFASKLS